MSSAQGLVLQHEANPLNHKVTETLRKLRSKNHFWGNVKTRQGHQGSLAENLFCHGDTGEHREHE
jgi:hypothetical protein